MFGRHGRCGDEISVSWMLDKITHEEVGSATQCSIVTTQEVGVARKEIVLPQMLRQPCASIRPHTEISGIDGTRDAPDVGIMMSHPTLCPIEHTRCLGTSMCQVVDHREERFVTLAEISHLSRPVIHLSIDIYGVFAVPGSIHAAIPHSLKVCRLSARLRR